MKTIGISNETYEKLVKKKLDVIKLTGNPSISFDAVILELILFLDNQKMKSHPTQAQQVAQRLQKEQTKHKAQLSKDKEEYKTYKKHKGGM